MPDELTEKIKDQPGEPDRQTGFSEGRHARANFGWVVEVVDNVRAAGVDQLGLLTDIKKAGSMVAPPPGATTPTPKGGQ